MPATSSRHCQARGGGGGGGGGRGGGGRGGGGRGGGGRGGNLSASPTDYSIGALGTHRGNGALCTPIEDGIVFHLFGLFAPKADLLARFKLH